MSNYTKTKYIIITLLLTGCFISCSDDDDSQSINIDYPSGIDDLTKYVSQITDFSSSVNPDTKTLTYDGNNLVTSETSSRNNTTTVYTYNEERQLSLSQKTNANNILISETKYTYGSDGLITIITTENGVEIENTQWKTLNSKAIESNATVVKGTNNVLERTLYSWLNEDIEQVEKFEKIDMVTSFNEFQDFPSNLGKTLENIIEFYNLEPLETDLEYYLINRSEYESYNEAINTLRYISTLVPITESQKIFMISQVYEYDEEKRKYFSATSYTTLNIDSEGYPIRLATGGYGAIKLDFLYD